MNPVLLQLTHPYTLPATRCMLFLSSLHYWICSIRYWLFSPLYALFATAAPRDFCDFCARSRPPISTSCLSVFVAKMPKFTPIFYQKDPIFCNKMMFLCPKYPKFSTLFFIFLQQIRVTSDQRRTNFVFKPNPILTF